MRITDEIPEGTIYIDNSLTCVGDGVTTVDICIFEPPNAQFPRGRVVYEGDIAPDPGATNDTTPEQANNELVIVFRTTVRAGVLSVSNQGEAQFDENGDGSVDDDINNGQPPVLTDDPAPTGNGDPTVAVLVTIPTLGTGALALLALLLATLGAMRRRPLR